jgi:hypothetical protein
MPKLFWLVYGKDDDITLFIQPAETLVYARLKASIAGIEGEYKEGYELDAKTAKRVPKAQIGKILSRTQATALLKKLDK